MYCGLPEGTSFPLAAEKRKLSEADPMPSRAILLVFQPIGNRVAIFLSRPFDAGSPPQNQIVLRNVVIGHVHVVFNAGLATKLRAPLLDGAVHLCRHPRADLFVQRSSGR